MVFLFHWLWFGWTLKRPVESGHMMLAVWLANFNVTFILTWLVFYHIAPVDRCFQIVVFVLPSAFLRLYIELLPKVKTIFQREGHSEEVTLSSSVGYSQTTD
jgi:hypothetical protein